MTAPTHTSLGDELRIGAEVNTSGAHVQQPDTSSLLDGLRATREQDQRTRLAQQLKTAAAWTLLVGAPVSIVALVVAVGVVGK